MAHTKIGSLLVAGALLGLAGCGGSSAPEPGVGGTAAHATSPASSYRALYVQFAQCVRDHGGSLPDPTFDDHGAPLWQTQPGTLSRAQTDPCQRLFDQARTLRSAQTGGGQAPDQAALMRFAQCMRQRGFPTFPDPDASGHIGLPPGVDKNSPQLQQASSACGQGTLKGGS